MAHWMRHVLSILPICTCFLVAVEQAQLLAGDLDKAPPGFQYNEQKAVFVDFKNVDLKLTFDVTTSRAVGRAVIQFEVAETGMPIFDLIPNPKDIKLNGVGIEPSAVVATQDPHKQSMLRIVSTVVDPGVQHDLELSYDISNEVTFTGETVAAGFFMSDLSDRQYWEQYGPTNYEFDQYAQSIDVEIMGANKSHEIIANGSVSQVSASHWHIEYPAYYTSSSFYFHLAR